MLRRSIQSVLKCSYHTPRTFSIRRTNPVMASIKMNSLEELAGMVDTSIDEEELQLRILATSLYHSQQGKSESEATEAARQVGEQYVDQTLFMRGFEIWSSHLRSTALEAASSLPSLKLSLTTHVQAAILAKTGEEAVSRLHEGENTNQVGKVGLSFPVLSDEDRITILSFSAGARQLFLTEQFTLGNGTAVDVSNVLGFVGEKGTTAPLPLHDIGHVAPLRPLSTLAGQIGSVAFKPLLDPQTISGFLSRQLGLDVAPVDIPDSPFSLDSAAAWLVNDKTMPTSEGDVFYFIIPLEKDLKIKYDIFGLEQTGEVPVGHALLLNELCTVKLDDVPGELLITSVRSDSREAFRKEQSEKLARKALEAITKK